MQLLTTHTTETSTTNDGISTVTIQANPPSGPSTTAPNNTATRSEEPSEMDKLPQPLVSLFSGNLAAVEHLLARELTTCICTHTRNSDSDSQTEWYRRCVPRIPGRVSTGVGWHDFCGNVCCSLWPEQHSPQLMYAQYSESRTRRKLASKVTELFFPPLNRLELLTSTIRCRGLSLSR